MAIPRTFTPRRVELPKPVEAARTRVLDVERQQQPEGMDDWCWAAVSSMVSVYFDRAAGLSQCRIASAVVADKGCLGDAGSPTKADCCQDPAPAGCNQEAYLSCGLRTAKHYDRLENVRATFDQVCAEIETGRPLAATIQWTGSDLCHFVLVTGYDMGGRTIHVVDPWDASGETTLAYDDFPEHYPHGQGTWIATYWTTGAR